MGRRPLSLRRVGIPKLHPLLLGPPTEGLQLPLFLRKETAEPGTLQSNPTVQRKFWPLFKNPGAQERALWNL